jgi:hypothetical protein
MMGEIRRSSEPSPLVANDHTTTTTPIAAAPMMRRVSAGGDNRSVRSDRCFGKVAGTDPTVRGLSLCTPSAVPPLPPRDTP